jgi:hypothetical protein
LAVVDLPIPKRSRVSLRELRGEKRTFFGFGRAPAMATVHPKRLYSSFMKTAAGVRVAAPVAPAGFNFPLSQSADPAGAEALPLLRKSPIHFCIF